MKYKKPTALPAPRYVANLMDWVESQINNDEIFPSKTGKHSMMGVKHENRSFRRFQFPKHGLFFSRHQDIPFPKNFQSVCKKILTRLFRVFVHVYIHHFDRLVAIGAEAHVNTCYKHFYYFVTEFELVSSKEFEPLVSNRT